MKMSRKTQRSRQSKSGRILRKNGLGALWCLAAGVCLLQLVYSQGWVYRRGVSPAVTVSQATPVEGTDFGEPLSGLSAREFELFRMGLDDFLEVESAEEGLGPVFNGLSCAQCHSQPRVGGTSTLMNSRAGFVYPDGRFEAYEGGTLYPMFSIPPHETQPAIPPEANVIARRKPLSVFGAGLVEAVPDAFLMALEDPLDRNRDGISGRAHRVLDRAGGSVRIGRFGWKAQQATLLAFAAEAYRDEMGITNDLFPQELCPPFVDCEVIGLIDSVPDPEDRRDRRTGLRGIDQFENFLRFLGPPPRGEISAAALRGERMFEAINCSSCHLPYLETADHPSPALKGKRFFPYGDFLLHDIGTGDGIADGEAGGSEIRTAPLWGVRLRMPLLHDGRASTLEEAIHLHGGEAAGSRRRYQQLSETDRKEVLAFLRSL